MAYSTGMMDERVKVLARKEANESAFGKGSGGYTWETKATVWASVKWTKGVKAMREGALDAYDSVMVRTRYNANLTRECRLEIDGKLYGIDSFHADKRANEIQVTATELTSV